MSKWTGTTYRHFPQLGTVEWAHSIRKPPFNPHPRARKGKYRKGIQYENKVTRRLVELYGIHYVPSAWFAYYAPEVKEKVQYCQTDGLLFLEDRNLVVAIEVKYRHMPDAYFQLNNLYLPVLRAAFSRLQVAVCEVVRWFDPAVPFPCDIHKLPDLSLAALDKFNVHILNR